MRRRARLGLGATVAAFALLLVVPTVALAYAPTGDDFITCTADGATVDCVAGVLAAGCATGVTTSTGFSDTVTASADGEVAFTFEVPTDHGDGDVAVTLRCEQGETKVLSDVIARVEDGEVAVAGIDTLQVLGLGGLALVLGAGILAVSRSGRLGPAGPSGRDGRGDSGGRGGRQTGTDATA